MKWNNYHTDLRIQHGHHIGITDCKKNAKLQTTTKISGKQWANIHLDWPLNSKMPRKEAVARFRLKTGHDCLAAHLHKIKVYSSDECTSCRIQGTSMNADHLLNCRKLDSSAQTDGNIAKLYWDARFLMG
jgi:hypothetical protein